VPAARDSLPIARAVHAGDSASVAVAVRGDSARAREEAGGAVAPPPPATRLSPMPPQVARVPKRVAPRIEPRVEPRAERRSVALAEHAHAAPSTSVISTSPIATDVPSAPAVAPAITTPATAAPTPAASPLANPAVLEELRAIHAEIDARKRHMDSLSAALDSLNHVTRPD